MGGMPGMEGLGDMGGMGGMGGEDDDDVRYLATQNMYHKITNKPAGRRRHARIRGRRRRRESRDRKGC